MSTTNTTSTSGALQAHFGHDEFRPGQQEAVEAAVGGSDVLLVMPTGAGKSIPAL